MEKTVNGENLLVRMIYKKRWIKKEKQQNY